ncbi:MAG: thioredoxin family protein [Crocinitomicaceae bacterium]|nr:thioredoxin family protein [Crocinitomicaceae bacterium]
MTWEEYENLFNNILDGTINDEPYKKEEYLNYVKLNNSRQNRWLKRGKLNDDLLKKVQNLSEAQSWILITEPWCGDASHTSPFIKLVADASEEIDLTINLRDGNESIIDDYLTNGTKSIPILIARDKNGNDLFRWGPRPNESQALFLANKNDETKSIEDKKVELQNWYNKDKGTSVQEELLALIK